MSESTKQPTENLLEDLAERFKCGSCKNNLRPPIRMCKNSHNFCDFCRKGNSNKCPICNVVLDGDETGYQHGLRNRELEIMAKVVFT